MTDTALTLETVQEKTLLFTPVGYAHMLRYRWAQPTKMAHLFLDDHLAPVYHVLNVRTVFSTVFISWRQLNFRWR